MGVSSLPKTVTRQPRDCDLNPCPSAPESGTLTTRLPSHPSYYYSRFKSMSTRYYAIASLLHSGAKNRIGGHRDSKTLPDVSQDIVAVGLMMNFFSINLLLCLTVKDF